MTKKNTAAARKSRTHFEQVPLAAVKKIASAQDSRKEKAGAGKARTPTIRG